MRSNEEVFTAYANTSVLRLFLLCVLQVLFGPVEDTAAAWHQSQAAAVNSLELEVKQMAMETWLREVGLAHHTAPLLALGLCSVEDLSDPVQAPDEVLLGAGLSQDEVITAASRS